MKENTPNENEGQQALVPTNSPIDTSQFPKPADEGEQLEIDIFRIIKVKSKRVNRNVNIAILLILVFMLLLLKS